MDNQVYILSIHSKRKKQQRHRWSLTPLSKTSGNPNSGFSSVGALGTGRGARSNGHKTCSEAMAASGSRRNQNKPGLFMEGDSSIIGATYVRISGSMLESLCEEERQGRIALPPKYGDQHRDVTLIERWVQFGIPILLILGLSMSEVVTDKTVVKIRKLGQPITLVADNFVRRNLVKPTKEEDMRNVDPILRILASAKHLRDFGPACQNLKDFVDEKRFTGTVRDLVALEGPPRGTFNNRNCPMYQLRRQRWIDIFNHAMRADPYNGSVHTLDSILMHVYATSPGVVSSDSTMHPCLQLRQAEAGTEINCPSVGVRCHQTLHPIVIPSRVHGTRKSRSNQHQFGFLSIV